MNATHSNKTASLKSPLGDLGVYKIYLKQAWQMLKEDKVISIITVLGTALAITMIMVIILTQRIKTTPIGPEVNRERTMYIPNVAEIEIKNQSSNLNQMNINNYKQFLIPLTTPEKLSLIAKGQEDVCMEGSDVYYNADIRYTDAAYWNIYSFSFLAGNPFNAGEFQSAIQVAVISRSIARKLFNETSNVLNKTIVLDKKIYRVIGVVEDVSTLCKYAYAQIWIPYTTFATCNIPNIHFFTAILLAKDKSDFSTIKSEVRRSEISNNPERGEKEIHFYGPFSEEELLIKGFSSFDTSDPDLWKGNLRFYLTLFVLLLIPAINLSGFSLFKIIGRTPEIGVRKAYGAGKTTILMQVLYENFLTSIIGGVIGLALSFIAVNLVKDKLFAQEIWELQLLGKNTIPVSAFISPWIFFYVILACILLNLLSSGIPAWRASRLRIAEAILS